MSYLFDYGEFLLCFGPVFFIIAMVGFILLINSWPSKSSKKETEAKDAEGSRPGSQTN